MFERLEGEHILLRKAKESDYKSMLRNVWGDPEVYQWMLFQPTVTEEEAIERCQRTMEFQKDHYAYLVADRKTDEAIGFCGIKEPEPGHFEESGIGIGTKCQGKGYGKEVVALLLDLAFRKLGAVDFTYGYFQDNVKSRKVAESFGFVYDHTYEMTRPWDGAEKIVDSCILTREKYLQMEKEIKTGHYGQKSLDRYGFVHCSELDTYRLVAPNFKDDESERVPNKELKQYANQ